jgi:hypothetical protein
MDCEGVCNGPRLIGDLDVDQVQDLVDVQAYVDGILGDDITPLPCNDANSDDAITVTDAALVADCRRWNVAFQDPDSVGTHDHCRFPRPEVIDPFDTVAFTISTFDAGAGWLEVSMRNPNRRVVGYELLFTGLEITTVENLVAPSEFPAPPQAAFGGQHVVHLSYVDSSIHRSSAWQPVLRVHFTNPENVICISEVVDVVNEVYTNPTTFLEDACVLSTGLAAPAAAGGVRVAPNPFRSSTLLSFHQPAGMAVRAVLYDLQGREVRSYEQVTGGRLEVERGDLAAGSYLFRIMGVSEGAGRLVVE